MARLPRTVIADEVYAYILGYVSDFNYSPTYGEIAEQFTHDGRYYTPEWGRWIVQELESQGRLKVEKKIHRGIRIITKE